MIKRIRSDCVTPVQYHSGHCRNSTSGVCAYLFLSEDDDLDDDDSLVITRPLMMHSITMNSQTTYERYNLLFDEKKLATDIFEILQPEENIINFDGNTLISDLFKKMDYYCENFSGDYLKAILFHLAEEILYNVSLVSKSFEQDNIYTTNPVILQANSYIEQHITEPLNIHILCTHYAKYPEVIIQ